MAQVNVPSKPGATYLGIESAYGVTPVTARVFPKNIPQPKPIQENVKREDEHVRGFHHQKPIQGLRTSETDLSFDVRPDATQLTGVAGPRPWLGIPLVAGFGGEAVGDGTTVAAASTATDLKLTSAAGFAAGGILAAEVGGTLEVARIGVLAGVDVTPWPSFSAAPTVAGLVVNSWCYYPTQANTNSLTVQHAKAAAGAAGFQWTLNGCTSELEIKSERGKAIELTTKLKGTYHTGPSAQALSVAADADLMATPLVMRDAFCYVQPTTTLTRVHYPLHSFALKLMLGDMLVPELGGVEGTTGMMRIPQRPGGSLTLKLRADAATDSTFYAGQTSLSVMIIVPVGSGLTKRFIVFDVPTAVIVAKPVFSDDGGRLVCELSLELLEDELTTGSTDLAKSFCRMALL